MANSSFFKSSGTTATTESTIQTQVDSATTSATNAANSATAAANSATAAATSATNASNSATTASSSATTATTQANTATTKATEAATSATSASTSASTATTQATTATNQATTATNQATTATTQAGLASDHRADAGKYAVTNHNTTFSLSSTNGGTSGLYSAKHYATEASTSATGAASSATSASGSATTATTKASEASTSASTATTKASEAATSATNASTSASTATTKASEASTSATNASNSATAAASSATSASSSASTATTKASEASTSATNAATSATAAANSATAAANSASSIGNITSLNDVTIASVADNEILQYNNSNSKWENQTLAEAGILTSETFTSLVQDTSPQLGGTLDANSNVIDMGSNNITDTKVGQWDTAYGWGNHASSNYLTANQTITLSGDVSGSGTTSIAVTIDDDSHNHTIANVDNLQTSLDAKAPLASPALTGNPTAPTQSASDNSTKIATTAYTDTAISNLVDSSPSTLNTLNELAAALGDDANFSTTVTNSIATKMPLAGGTFTGGIIGTTATFSDTIISRKADDVELIVHADTTSSPVSEIQLMRGTNDTWGADIYTDWKIENGYGSSGSSAGTLRIARGYNGSTTTIMEFGPPSSSSAKVYAPLTVGVNDTGHDVKFFGDTSGKYMEWDASADQLNVAGTIAVDGNNVLTSATGAAISHTQASSTITDFASAASAEAIPFAIALG